jgi:hypothetical protein
MPSQSKKRFNAFEDFPSENSEIKIKLKPEQPSGASATEVERIERLKPSQMMPDRFQPRRLLPASLRMDFFSGKLGCYAAAEQWLSLSRSDAGMSAEVEGLMAMGKSFKDHGQIKPITGSWVSGKNGSYVFQIETGERRFWAACLQKVERKQKEEPLLRVEVVTKPTRQRQVLENRHTEIPSAVEQACEVAALILSDLGIAPEENLEDEFDYFRKVNEQRMPAGLWDRIMPIMLLTRPRMVQLLNILRLPTDLLELADRYRLPERVLREVLLSPREQWDAMIRLSIQSQLTSDEVAEIASKGSAPASPVQGRTTPVPSEPGRESVKALRRFARLMTSLRPAERTRTLDALADDLMVQGQAENVLILMTDLAQLIQARLKRK